MQVAPDKYVKAHASNTRLFKVLRNEWYFKPGPTPDSCCIDFVVEYQFHNWWYSHVRAVLSQHPLVVDSHSDHVVLVRGVRRCGVWRRRWLALCRTKLCP